MQLESGCELAEAHLHLRPLVEGVPGDAARQLGAVPRQSGFSGHGRNGWGGRVGRKEKPGVLRVVLCPGLTDSWAWVSLGTSPEAADGLRVGVAFPPTQCSWPSSSPFFKGRPGGLLGGDRAQVRVCMQGLSCSRARTARSHPWESPEAPCPMWGPPIPRLSLTSGPAGSFLNPTQAPLCLASLASPGPSHHLLPALNLSCCGSCLAPWPAVRLPRWADRMGPGLRFVRGRGPGAGRRPALRRGGVVGPD